MEKAFEHEFKLSAADEQFINSIENLEGHSYTEAGDGYSLKLWEKEKQRPSEVYVVINSQTELPIEWWGAVILPTEIPSFSSVIDASSRKQLRYEYLISQADEKFADFNQVKNWLSRRLFRVLEPEPEETEDVLLDNLPPEVRLHHLTLRYAERTNLPPYRIDELGLLNLNYAATRGNDVYFHKTSKTHGENTLGLRYSTLSSSWHYFLLTHEEATYKQTYYSGRHHWVTSMGLKWQLISQDRVAELIQYAISEDEMIPPISSSLAS